MLNVIFRMTERTKYATTMILVKAQLTASDNFLSDSRPREVWPLL